MAASRILASSDGLVSLATSICLHIGCLMFLNVIVEAQNVCSSVAIEAPVNRV
jgi:hypothetical protein